MFQWNIFIFSEADDRLDMAHDLEFSNPGIEAALAASVLE